MDAHDSIMLSEVNGKHKAEHRVILPMRRTWSSSIRRDRKWNCGWVGGGTWSLCLMDTEFQLGAVKDSGGSGGAGCKPCEHG